MLCGDARAPAAYQQLLEGERADMVFTDPPWNVPINGHVSGLGRVKHADWDLAAGEMTEAEFVAFLKAVFRLMAENSIDGSIHFTAIDWRHLWEALNAGRAVYTELKNLCVWNKNNGGMGTFYRSKHELFLVWKKREGAAHQHLRARSARASSHQCLGLPRRQHVSRWANRGAEDASDREAGRDGRRRSEGLLPAKRARPRLLLRFRNYDHSGRKDRPPRTRARDHASLR
jgi:hypothetical protein